MKKILLATILSVSLSLNANELVITTGVEGGYYERLGDMISKSIGNQAKKKKLNITTATENSNGSIENIEKINDGDAHIAIVQSDALNVLKPKVSFKSKSAHTETVFWVYNAKNEYEDLEDIEGKKDVLMVLVDGSGAQITMQSFVNEDDGYKVNIDSAILADDLYEAADIVSEGKFDGKKVAGLLYVGRSIPVEIAQDFKSKIKIGEATDGDFNDAKNINGDDLYFHCDISDKQLSGLRASTFGKPDTLCMESLVIYTDHFDSKKEKRIVSKGITKALSRIK